MAVSETHSRGGDGPEDTGGGAPLPMFRRPVHRRIHLPPKERLRPGIEESDDQASFLATADPDEGSSDHIVDEALDKSVNAGRSPISQRPPTPSCKIYTTSSRKRTTFHARQQSQPNPFTRCLPCPIPSSIPFPPATGHEPLHLTQTLSPSPHTNP
jgi:hypothetical protein